MFQGRCYKLELKKELGDCIVFHFSLIKLYYEWRKLAILILNGDLPGVAAYSIPGLSFLVHSS